MYIGELSSPKFRGMFTSLPAIALAVGVLLVYLLGAIPGFSYQYISLVAVAITAVFVLLVAPPWVPMTPRYLIMKGRWEEALNELKWLRGPNVQVNEEAEDIKQVVAGTERLTLRELCFELTKQKSIISLSLMVFIMAFQLLSGIDVLITFAGNIFKDAGYANPWPHILASFSIALTLLIVAILSLFIIDLFGRKILLVVSGLSMVVSCFALGTYFFLTRDCSKPDYSLDSSICSRLKPLVIVSITLFTAGFSIGWGSIPFVLLPELFSLKTRGLFAGLVAAVNWGSSGLTTGTYPAYSGLVQPYGVWITFGLLNLISTGFVAIFIPETRGKKLENIEDQLQNRYRLCVWK